MAKGFIEEATLTAIADQIRTLIGSTAGMLPGEMDENIGTAIAAVESSKTAIRNKGVSVPTAADVTDLETYIAKIVTGTTGYTVKSGTYTPNSSASSITISHGLGKKPVYGIVVLSTSGYSGLSSSTSALLVARGTGSAGSVVCKVGNVVRTFGTTNSATFTSSEVTFSSNSSSYSFVTYVYAWYVWG